MTDNEALAFAAREYDSLRTEILHSMESVKSLESQTAIGSVAIYAWIFSGQHGDIVHLIRYAVWIPVVYSVINFLLLCRHANRAWEIGDYLSALELRLAPGNGGWETYRKARRNAPERAFFRRLGVRMMVRGAAWGVLIAGNVVAAIAASYVLG